MRMREKAKAKAKEKGEEQTEQKLINGPPPLTRPIKDICRPFTSSNRSTRPARTITPRPTLSQCRSISGARASGAAADSGNRPNASGEACENPARLIHPALDRNVENAGWGPLSSGPPDHVRSICGAGQDACRHARGAV